MLFSALFSLIPTPVFAAGETAQLTPPTGLSQAGSTFDVSIDGYVGHAYTWWFARYGASSVQGSITFPANLLRVVSFNTAGSSFPEDMNPTVSGGTITFSGSTSSGTHMDTNVHLFTIKFQSLAPGTANVTFGSTQYDLGTATTTGGTYTISSPPPPPPPPPQPPRPSTTPKVTPKPSATPTPTPTPSVAAAEETPTPVLESDGGLQIQNVKITTSRQENKITWTINNATAIPEFTYGTAKNNLRSKGTVNKADAGYTVLLDDLKPGTLYYFMIKAATPDNLQGANYSGVLTTRGYPIQLTIQQNNLLLPGAKVKINERTFVANKNAIITTELSDGKHSATITPTGSSESYEAVFTVVKKSIPENGNPELQSFVLNITTIGSSSGAGSTLTLPIVGGAVALIAAIGGILGFIFFKRKKKAEQDNTVDSDLLAATYGNAINNYRSNTPEPNLGMNSAAVSSQPIAAPPQDQNMQNGGTQVATFPQNNGQVQAAPVSQPSLPPIEQQQSQPVINTAPTVDSSSPYPINSEPVPMTTNPAIDPSLLPLPTANTTVITEQPVLPQEYTDEEQLSPDVTSVEAGQDSSPSAIYDPETGDLAIVHHHNTPTATVTGQSSSMHDATTPLSEPVASTQQSITEQEISTDKTNIQQPPTIETLPTNNLTAPSLTVGSST